jgi:alpha-glucosidase (family GH31 glycosyl hydrolase)
VFWAGDQLVSWDEFDGLRSCVNAYLSGGYSGMTLLSSDIGGYTMQQYVVAVASHRRRWRRALCIATRFQ